MTTLTVGQLVKRHRNQRISDGATTTWTQQDLAEAIGWEVHTVQRLESGNRKLKLAEAVLICDVLSIPWAALEQATRLEKGGAA